MEGKSIGRAQPICYACLLNWTQGSDIHKGVHAALPCTDHLSSVREIIAEQGEKRNEDDGLPCRE